jgi:hypothetical protein
VFLTSGRGELLAILLCARDGRVLLLAHPRKHPVGHGCS